MVLKKVYMLVGPKKDVHQELCTVNGAAYPCVLVFKENWVVTTGDNVCLFERLGKPVPGGTFSLHASSKSNPILSMAVKQQYLLVMRELGVRIFNLNDCCPVQEISFEKGLVFKDFAMEGNSVLMAMNMASGAKKELASSLVYLREVPVEDQIKALLAVSKVKDAHNIFLQNYPSTVPDFESKQEQFNADAAWTLFSNLEYSQASEYFLHFDYDPRELLALIPEMHDFKEKLPVTLRSLAEKKLSNPVAPSDPAIADGVNAIMFLVEEKRKFFSNSYNIEAEPRKQLGFVWPSAPLNPVFKGKRCSLEDVLKTMDMCMLKLYVENRNIKRLQGFVEATKALKCDFKELEEYLTKRQDSDQSSTASICLAMVYEREGNYSAALSLWKHLTQVKNPEIKELVTKAMISLLSNKVRDKKLITDYAKFILIVNADEGLKIFTENPSLSEIFTEDDVIAYLERLEAIQPMLKQRYLEYLVNRPGSAERFHTRLALHYVTKIKDAVSKEKKQASELSSESVSGLQYRKTFNQFLRKSRNYSTTVILEAIKGMNLFDEEILLYSIDKRHNEALNSLVAMGRQNIDFSAAEQYCMEQTEPLFALLLEKILTLYTETKNKYIVMQNEQRTKEKEERSPSTAVKSELEALRKYATGYECYCKSFIKKYAANEKMDAEAVLKILPDDWAMKDQRDGKEDESLLDYLILALNDRLGKQINYGIAKNAAEMEKLDLQYQNAKLQEAFVMISPSNVCKVCLKELGAKSFYVYPNGVVTHMQCAKDLNVCPVTNVHFTKKVYD